MEAETAPIEDNAYPARRRVRTPGKHIVLFTLAATFMLALSTTALQSNNVRLSDYSLPELSGDGAAGEAKQVFAPSADYLVDLAPDAEGRAALLKMRIAIAARDRAALIEIKDAEPRIRERVSFFLRELSADDFAGTEAMARVRGELLKRVRLALSEGAASDLVIEDIIVQ